MHRIQVLAICMIGIGLLIFGVPLLYASEVVPPTDAIVMINGTGGNVTAKDWDGYIELVEGAGISYSFDYANNELTISSGKNSFGGQINL